MSYVLVRNEDGKYVAPPGLEYSYTSDVSKAQRFTSREAAEKNKCGNEAAVPLESLLQPPERD